MKFQKKDYDWSCVYTLLLVAHYGKVSASLLQKIIGYPHYKITERRQELKIPRREKKQIPDEAKQWLYDNRHIYTNEELAKKVNELYPREGGYKASTISTFLYRSNNKRDAKTRSEMRSRILKQCHKNGKMDHDRGYENGTIMIYHRNDRESFKVIKIENGFWRRYHLHVWEQHNGPLPKNMNIKFKDGNRLNCNIENLYLEPRNEVVYNEQMDLTDKYIASLLLRDEPKTARMEKKDILIENYSSLIKMKKLSLKAKRDVKQKSKLANSDKKNEGPLL